MGDAIEPQEEVESVRDLEIEVRDRVNDPKRGPRLRKNQKAWNEIVSSLDALGDTELALSAYEHGGASPPGTGLQYLMAYGALQALFIQQDALIHLCAALEGPGYEDIMADSRLAKAREVRNQAVGHPTRKDRPKSKPATTHQIARFSLALHAFDMWTSDETGKHKREVVDVLELIQNQRAAVADKLRTLRDKLDEDDRKAREAVQHERLADLFPETLDYTLEKLWEATQGSPGRAELGPVSIQIVKDVLTEFLHTLERRGLDKDAYPGIQGWFSEIDHPIQELERFFNDGQSGLHFKTAAIVATHLSDQVAELQKMAASIDEEWRVDQSKTR